MALQRITDAGDRSLARRLNRVSVADIEADQCDASRLRFTLDSSHTPHWNVQNESSISPFLLFSFFIM
jgi:hypothetical protein